MRKASKNNNRRDKSLSNKKFKSEDKNLNKTNKNNKNNKQKVAKKASAKNTIIVSNKNEIRDEVRLNKYISETGFCSRREADKLIEQGRVKIDGVKARTGMKVSNGQSVSIDGKPLKVENELVYIALNKPVGITCTTESKIKGNIVDFINHEKRIFPIGRLDKDSQGLIFMTNDGDIVNKILRAGNNHEKEYIVTVNKPITDEFIKGMSNGVPILGTVTKKCLVKKESKNSFRIILTQGLNRQIRRMCEYFGYEVKKLERIRIMNVSLGNLKMGSWRYLTKKELAEINRLTENSSKTEEASI
ncbi:23S rRNA pseudouridine(2604) synthase RluF [Clostridium perfringens]|uniref:23S rRNA pseudouridine(2604) synthase RluF n=1 Tax=Clostridium perfringens TaxID=1502 RepID=UPI000705D7FC|nr:23S rRNA pseudouridine(2604) synthase RluF [Clostridium perfringens]ALG49911.1 Ribosomal large subunit pseudouridine synthase F [Clostridium perfringens]EHK2403645.1 23S rRNA pseudouridine(2604) synthase RluF [Clostridium perfringens]EJT5934393.1 23S rRNA pseudouridine(2604) synthase RluF [Clostridium perfringens]EJT6502076.1 23S rRNA pseudouridine(2604) synthase RluF [Clostridium perfringens]EJT6534621.1 23S rRNA pseudouridine(2604) synthase RluF [Clostridium perfringens]